MNFFQNSRGAPFLLNFQILFKKVQCQSSGYVLVKFDSNRIGRSKVYSANKFRGHPHWEATLRANAKSCMPMIICQARVKFRENRSRGFRDITVLVVGRNGKKTKKGKRKKRWPLLYVYFSPKMGHNKVSVTESGLARMSNRSLIGEIFN